MHERDPADVDGAATGQKQHPQRLLMLARPRQRQRLGRKACARGPDRNQRVIGTAQTPFATRLAPDPEHPPAVHSKKAAQTGAVMTGAPDRPQTRTGSVPVREAQRIGMTAPVSPHRGLRPAPPP